MSHHKPIINPNHSLTDYISAHTPSCKDTLDADAAAIAERELAACLIPMPPCENICIAGEIELYNQHVREGKIPLEEARIFKTQYLSTHYHVGPITNTLLAYLSCQAPTLSRTITTFKWTPRAWSITLEWHNTENEILRKENHLQHKKALYSEMLAYLSERDTYIEYLQESFLPSEQVALAQQLVRYDTIVSILEAEITENPVDFTDLARTYVEELEHILADMSAEIDASSKALLFLHQELARTRMALYKAYATSFSSAGRKKLAQYRNKMTSLSERINEARAAQESAESYFKNVKALHDADSEFIKNLQKGTLTISALRKELISAQKFPKIIYRDDLSI